jgi:hypothetical protein
MMSSKDNEECSICKGIVIDEGKRTSREKKKQKDK